MRFIELHESDEGKIILVNINNVVSITLNDEEPYDTQISTIEDVIWVKESIDEIKRKIYG